MADTIIIYGYNFVAPLTNFTKNISEVVYCRKHLLKAASLLSGVDDDYENLYNN